MWRSSASIFANLAESGSPRFLDSSKFRTSALLSILRMSRRRLSSWPGGLADLRDLSFEVFQLGFDLQDFRLQQRRFSGLMCSWLLGVFVPTCTLPEQARPCNGVFNRRPKSHPATTRGRSKTAREADATRPAAAWTEAAGLPTNGSRVRLPSAPDPHHPEDRWHAALHRRGSRWRPRRPREPCRRPSSQSRRKDQTKRQRAKKSRRSKENTRISLQNRSSAIGKKVS